MDVTLEVLAAELAKQLEGVEGRLDARLTKGFDEVKHEAALHREALKQDVIAAAEGYGANLERIERELVALNKKMDTKFGDHDLVLKNHNERISTLEARR